MNDLPVAICGRLKISLRIDESAFQKFHQKYENFIKTVNFGKILENLKFSAPMRPIKYKNFRPWRIFDFKKLFNCQWFDGFNRKFNRKWEFWNFWKFWSSESGKLKVFMRRFKSFILEVTCGLRIFSFRDFELKPSYEIEMNAFAMWYKVPADCHKHRRPDGRSWLVRS